MARSYDVIVFGSTGYTGRLVAEHLLLSALNGCLMAGFAAVARAQGVGVRAYASRAHAVLDRTDDGVAFTRFRIEVDVACAAGDEERVRAAMARAKARCFVANALRLPVKVDVNVTGVEMAETPVEAVHAQG